MIRSTITRPSNTMHTEITDQDLDDHSIHSDDTVLSVSAVASAHNYHKSNKDNKLIQCGACFRSFHTQAQFGQHSRICREGKAVIRHLITGKGYKYAFLEKQTKQKLEVKSRFVIIADADNWKTISRKAGLYDGGIKKLLHSKEITNVDVAIRQRRASGLIVANFMVRNVSPEAQAIHYAKASIERAVDCVYDELPNNIEMRLHLCKTDNCQELVIRDTEGYCSRHRAQKYHKKNQTYKKRKKDGDFTQKRKQSKELKHVQHKRPTIKAKAMKKNTCKAMAVNNGGPYDKLLNHLKATAPATAHEAPSSAAIASTNLQQSDNINNITIEESANETDVNHTINSTQEDDEIVARILANLRATCMNAHAAHNNINNKKRKLNEMESNQDAQPAKKRKLLTDDDRMKSDNCDMSTARHAMNDTFYMVPIAVNPSLLNAYQAVQYVPVTMPMQPLQAIPYALVPVKVYNNSNNKNAEANIPPLPPLASYCNVVKDKNEDNQSQS